MASSYGRSPVTARGNRGDRPDPEARPPAVGSGRANGEYDLEVAVQAAFFDLDKTVIAKASMAAFSGPLYREGLISPWLVARAVWGQFLFKMWGADEERMRKVRESALRITRGWDQSRINTIVRDTLTEVIDPIVYDEALDLIRHHQSEGRRVYLISASPEEIVAPLARHLGVDEAIATRAELDEHGHYTGQVEFYAYGPYKAAAIEKHARLLDIDLAESYAYSDSVTDLPMLESVGNPVAVNPDRELEREAEARGWEIRHFEHGVPLRDRVPMPDHRVLLATALVTGIVAAAVGWRLLRREPAPPPSGWERLAGSLGRPGGRTPGRRFRPWSPGAS